MSSKPDPMVVSILDGLHDAAVLVGRDFKLRYANRNLYRVMGWSRKKWATAIEKGLDHFDWMHGGGEQERQWASQCLETGKAITQAEVYLQLKGGVDGLCQLNYIPFGHADVQHGLVLIYRDVSDEAKLQKDYREMLDKEKQRADDLEALVQERTRQLKSALDEVLQLSRIDPLTGLLNRRAFIDTAEPMLKLAERHRRMGAILICDLDHFKAVNDTFGHQAGDLVLVETAKALKGSVRQEDVVCRYGGEEFVIYLSELEGDGAAITAQRCLESIRQIPMQELIPGKDSPQTMSMGIALIPECGTHLDELVSKADEALYASKHNGRDRFTLYSDLG